MHKVQEVLRDYYDTAQVLQLRAEAKREGRMVNVTRHISGMVEIEIFKYKKETGETENK